METTKIKAPKKIWSPLKKISFRFFFSYFSLFIIFQNNTTYPFYKHVEELFNKVLYKIIPTIGETILGISYTIRTGPNGSGDTTYDYVLLFTIFIISILACIIWSLLDRKRKHYKKMYYWLTVAIRFYIGLMLINYGMWKLIKLQFGYPSMQTLTQTFGESSPMRLAWTFLGFSKGYNIFMGLAEVAAVFLLFRRTLAFGLIITLATTANVMAVNYFYDVPVKITSTHLVMMTLFLLAYNFKELCDFFFFKKPVKLSIIAKPKVAKIPKIIFLVLKILIIVNIGFGFYSTKQYQDRSLEGVNDTRIKGFYEVKSFVVNKDTISRESRSGIKKWKYLFLKYKRFAMVKDYNNKGKWYKLKVDSLQNKFTLEDYRDSLKKYDLRFEKKDSIFHIRGNFQKDTLSIKLIRTEEFRKKFLLTNRGFHWINERPLNR
ncbi:hypothetical protein [Polaribacter porphyrae]|uniref:DoxX family protein n=1 Tax=Polaribacter porphyrae TaxID=1137780 RepID=A0A2S7WR75_9FLAO|nr:hypothetical protein [Polaribacter porphyrae]PQJ80107.1 hypothetical protein BTO18_13395 [Polaribacter porphyrae]